MAAKTSVVIPVYNGEKFLSAAIESVIAQSVPDWDLTVLDNRSTDSTAEIVQEYSRRDPRVRLAANDEFLPIIDNWNAAIRLISPQSKYCKVLHADDLLEPNCLEVMIAVAESSPSIGLVAGQVRSDHGLEGQGLPTDRVLFKGGEIGRRTLLGEVYVFGNPSALLVRSDVVRERQPGFYDSRFYHADYEVCFDILRIHDFGMVHAPVSFTRKHPDSQSNTFATRFNTAMLDDLAMLGKHGRYFLSDGEFRDLMRKKKHQYRHLFARRYIMRMLTDRKKAAEYWDYHRRQQEALGISFSYGDVALGLASEGATWASAPRQSWYRLRDQMQFRKISP